MEEQTGKLKPAGRATRQNDGLKRVERHPEAAKQSADKRRDVHESPLVTQSSDRFQPYQSALPAFTKRAATIGDSAV
jgi:23S rRNA A2030 N6-methylase RlmJ